MDIEVVSNSESSDSFMFQQDYELLEEVDVDDVEVLDAGEDLDAEPIKRDEVHIIINQ